jgi:hypothetical protein
LSQLFFMLLAVLPTLAITWPQGALSEEEDLTAAAQVHGVVS